MNRILDKIHLSMGLLATVATACILGMVGVAVANSSAEAGHAVVMAQIEADRAKAEKSLKSVENLEPVSVDEQRTQAASARGAGEQVAELQNRYIGIEAGDVDLLVETSEALADMFADPDDASAGRTPWPVEASVERSWRFVTTVSSSAATIPSLWLLEESGDGNRVISYVLADYEVESGKFSNLEKHVTSYGSQLSMATGPVDVYSSESDDEAVS